MTTHLAGLPPQTAARIAGVLYLIIIAGGLFAEAFVRQQLIVPGDPGAKARNILEQELLYRVGFAVHLFSLACALPLTLIFYRLFLRAKNGSEPVPTAGRGSDTPCTDEHGGLFVALLEQSVSGKYLKESKPMVEGVK